VHSLAQRAIAHIRRDELLHAGDRVGVAVSGGIDSVALLRLLLDLRSKLGIVLSVVHFNHKLRGAEGDEDQEFVARLAREHELDFYSDCADVAAYAGEMGISVEAAARNLRFEFFSRLLGRGTSAEAPFASSADNRGAGSAAPPKIEPQGLKPDSFDASQRGAKAPLFHLSSEGRRPEAGSRLDKIATGHTLDDQAETVLLRLIRGTGMRGLGGIYPRILVERSDDEHESEGHGEIIRPLLGIRRHELRQYLTELHQPWREDSTNADARFTRNRVRQIVLPLLEREFNPAIAENLADLAEIARGEQDYWENEISGWMGTVVQWSRPKWALELERAQSLVQIQSLKEQQTQNAPDESPQKLLHESQITADASINRAWLLTEPLAAQRRLIKAIGEHAGIPLELQHIEAILHFAAEPGPSGKALSLPRGWRVVRAPETVVFLSPDPRSHASQARDYEYPLPVPGRAFVSEAGIVVEALRLPPQSQAVYNPQQLLRAELLPAQLTVRNWRPGDRFWPAHTKAPRKIKDLLQERRLPQPERRLWPVAISGDEIVWMRGFPVPQQLRAQPDREAVLIREMALVEEEE
jgi:tRNA(Ile)-lysidine synthase